MAATDEQYVLVSNKATDTDGGEVDDDGDVDARAGSFHRVDEYDDPDGIDCVGEVDEDDGYKDNGGCAMRIIVVAIEA